MAVPLANLQGWMVCLQNSMCVSGLCCAKDLLDVLNSCYLTGCLSLSQHSGVITLLYKRGGGGSSLNEELATNYFVVCRL